MMKTHQKVGLSFWVPLLIILFLAGNATADTYSFSVSSTLGDRDTFNFTVNSIGTINAGATWTGTAANLALILYGPGQVDYYARKDGPSPLSLNYTVTSADLSKGSGWTLSIVNFRGGDATGTATKTYPTGPTPASGVTTPSGPRNIKATTGDGYVTLGWSAPSDDGGYAITEYKIYRGTSSGGESYLTSVSAPTTFYKDTAVTNGQTYYYQVSAVNYVGEGEKSSEKSVAPASASGPKQIPTATPHATSSPTPMPTATATATPTATPHATARPTPTPGPETEPTPTATPHATSTPTPGPEPTPTPTAAPTATPTPTPSFQELIEEELRKLSSGRILFNPPEKMKVGVKERVVVRLTKDITENLTEGLKGPGAPQIEPIEVGTFMTVTLTGGDSFDINALSSEEQVVKPVGFTEWSWYVRPLKPGVQELLLTVTVRILVTGQDEQKIDWRVMDKQISVEVNPPYTFKRFIECYWQWIVATIISAIAVIPIILKLVRRTRKK